MFVVAHGERDSETTAAAKSGLRYSAGRAPAAAVVSSLVDWGDHSQAKVVPRTRTREPDGLQAGCSRGKTPQPSEIVHTSTAPQEDRRKTSNQSDRVSSRAGNSAEAAAQDVAKIDVFARRLWIRDVDTVTTGVTRGVAGGASISGRLLCPVRGSQETAPRFPAGPAEQLWGLQYLSDRASVRKAPECSRTRNCYRCA